VDSALRICAGLHLCAQLSGQGDKVVRQSRKAGEIAEWGSALIITAREKPETGSLRMPDLTGLPLRQAVLRLHQMRLKVNVEGSGFVRAQKPAVGETIKEKSVCHIIAG